MDTSHNLYHQNSYGQAIRCRCRQEVILTFGNISLLLTQEQIGGFASHVDEAMTIYRPIEDPDERSIFLATGVPAIMLAMTYNELILLSDILSHTRLMIQVENALN